MKRFSLSKEKRWVVDANLSLDSNATQAVNAVVGAAIVNTGMTLIGCVVMSVIGGVNERKLAKIKNASVVEKEQKQENED